MIKAAFDPIISKILEKEGLVERHRNPENQREVLVEAYEVCQGAVSGESTSAAYQRSGRDGKYLNRV